MNATINEFRREIRMHQARLEKYQAIANDCLASAETRRNARDIVRHERNEIDTCMLVISSIKRYA